LHPARHRRADDGLGRRADDERLFELRLGIGHQTTLTGDQPVVGNDGHLLGEAIDMLGFLGKIAQRNEQREIAVVDARGLDPLVHQPLDAFPDAIAPWSDDHAAAHARLLGHVGGGDDFLIPCGEIRRAAGG